MMVITRTKGVVRTFLSPVVTCCSLQLAPAETEAVLHGQQHKAMCVVLSTALNRAVEARWISLEPVKAEKGPSK